jgi:hypothetical protein
MPRDRPSQRNAEDGVTRVSSFVSEDGTVTF